MKNIIQHYAEIQVSDNTIMRAYIAAPEGDEILPGILVFQEAFGVNAHIRHVTERIAAEGYVAISPELFHRSAGAGFEGSYTDFESVRPHIQALTTEGLKADIQAAYNHFMSLKNVDKNKIAAIGFCMGGRVSFMASTMLPIKSAACFYGSGIAENWLREISKINNPLLFCWGGLDKHITKEKIDAVTHALDAQQKDYVNVIYSKADHAFFCDARANYNPKSAAEAWALVKEFWKVNW